MNKVLRLGMLMGLTLFVVACTGPSAGHDTGTILLSPYTNETMSITTMVPQDWAEVQPGEFHRGSSPVDATTLILVALPRMTPDEMANLAVAQLGLDQLPESTAVYHSPHLTWHLYAFDMDRPEAGMLRADLALAEGEAASYVILAAAYTYDYERNPALFETVFLHTLHAFAPLE